MKSMHNTVTILYSTYYIYSINILKVGGGIQTQVVKRLRPSEKGLFFSKSKLSLQQWLVVLHWWCRQYPVTDAAEEANVSKVTAIQCYQYLRDMCSWRLQNRDAPLLLGGSGNIVQIDESLFHHKVKVWLN